MSLHSSQDDGSKDCDKSGHSLTIYRDLTAVIAVLGVTVAGILLVVIVPCAKAYKSFLQRVIIFIVISMLSEDLCRVLGTLFKKSSEQEPLCEALGFVTLMFHWCTYLLYLVWLAYLLAIVCVRTTHTSAIVTKLKTSSKKLRVFLEAVVLVSALFGPAITVLWTPFYVKQYEYGFDGHICAIMPTSNSSNVSSKVVLTGQLYSYTPILLTGLVAVILTVGVTVVYCTVSRKLKPTIKHAIKNLATLSLSIIGFLLTYFLVSLILNTLICNNLVVYGMNTTFTTLGKFVIIVGYLIAFHWTRKRKKKMVNSNNMQANKEYGTFKESSRETAPSNTHFTVPYTGEFSRSHNESQNVG